MHHFKVQRRKSLILNARTREVFVLGVMFEWTLDSEIEHLQVELGEKDQATAWAITRDVKTHSIFGGSRSTLSVIFEVRIDHTIRNKLIRIKLWRVLNCLLRNLISVFQAVGTMRSFKKVTDKIRSVLWRKHDERMNWREKNEEPGNRLSYSCRNSHRMK